MPIAQDQNPTTSGSDLDNVIAPSSSSKNARNLTNQHNLRDIRQSLGPRRLPTVDMQQQLYTVSNSHSVSINGTSVYNSCGGQYSTGQKLRPDRKAALNQIKQSLLPFDSTNNNNNNVICQSTNGSSTSSGYSGSLPNGSASNTDTLSSESSSGSSDFKQEYAMLECLMSMGFDRDAAFYALKLTQFRHIQHAVDILLKTNSPHIYGKAHLQRKTSFETSEGCSSRSESPMTPTCVIQSQSPSSTSTNQKQMYHFSAQQTTSQGAPTPCLIQRTPSPMAKTGIVNAGGFFVQSSSKNYDDVSTNNDSTNRISCFVRQKISPAVAQSKKVEKPSPQCAEKFLQQDLLPQQFYSRLSVNNGNNNNYFQGNNRQCDQQTSSNKIVDFSYQQKYDFLQQQQFFSVMASESQSPRQSDARYLEHLFQRVNNVLTSRSPQLSSNQLQSGMLGPQNLFSRKRDSAASSSSGGNDICGDFVLPNTNTGRNQSPAYSNSVLPNGDQGMSPPHHNQHVIAPTKFIGSDDLLCSSPSQQVRRVESPLPDSVKSRLENSKDPSPRFSFKPCTPQAFKFFMEQHIENVIKEHKERQRRLLTLEKEMQRANFYPHQQCQMRNLLQLKESQYLRLKRQKMDATLFTKIKVIGVGAFGEVTLVRKKDTKTLYAMKTLRKSDVIRKNQAAHVKAERDILSEADNEWVVKLYYSFQDKDNLFFIMEYIPGGDMMALLIKKGTFEECLARFYIAELVCAIESVHRLKFIHRDIKPDNILIDENGHIKLTDFGLCTGLRWTHDWKRYAEQTLAVGHSYQDSFDLLQMREPSGDHKILDFRQQRSRRKAHSLVGTPNYIAPEVLLRIGHTQLCDFWSVGVILYEMVVGHPPFLANSPEETQLKVVHWRDTLVIPREANLTHECEDLILGLCRGHEDRLGRLPGATDIKQHQFFQDIDWDNLRRMKAPYKPEISHPTDTSNFDPVEVLRRDDDENGNFNTQESDDPVSTNNRKQTPAVDHAFYEFTFRRFFNSDGKGCPTLIDYDHASAARRESTLEPLFEPDESDTSVVYLPNEIPSNRYQKGYSEMPWNTTNNVNILRINAEDEACKPLDEIVVQTHSKISSNNSNTSTNTIICRQYSNGSLSSDNENNDLCKTSNSARNFYS